MISQRPEKNASVMDTALLRQMFRTMMHRVDQRIAHNNQRLERLEHRAAARGPRQDTARVVSLSEVGLFGQHG